MMDLLKNYKSNVAAKKKNFKLKFRSKKDKPQSIVILSRDWERKNDEFSFLKGIKSSEEIPEIKYDCRLTVNRLGEFYLCIPKPQEIRADNQGPKFSVAKENRGAGIISLDPGVRTFMTDLYDPSRWWSYLMWESGYINRIYRLCPHHDRNLMVDECHGKFARWLCEKPPCSFAPRVQN